MLTPMNQNTPVEPQPNYYEDFGPEIHLRDYFRILWIRRWLILLSLTVVVVAAVYYVQTTEPMYESTVVLYYQRDNQSSYLLEALNPMPETLEVEAQKEFLTSPAVLKRVIDGLRLQSTLNFTMEELERLDKAMDITSPRGSHILKLKAQAGTPQKAQILAQLAAYAFMEENTERKTSELTLALDFLEAQIGTIETELESIEGQLNQFRSEEGMYASGGNRVDGSKVSYSLLAQLSELQREQTGAQMELALAESQLAIVQRQLDAMWAQIQPSDMVSAMSTSGLPPQIEEYQKKVVDLQVQLDASQDSYTEKSDQVIQLRQQLEAAKNRLQEEVDQLMKTGEGPDPLSEWRVMKAQKIAQEANVGSLKRKEQFYQEKIADFNAQHPEMVTKEVQLMRLERTARQYEETYSFLMQKKKETELLKQMKQSDFHEYKPADFPEAPFKPRKRMTLALALVLGLMLGVGSAFFLHYMDDSVQSPEQVERLVGLSVLGSIPTIPVSGDHLKKARMLVAQLKTHSSPENGNPPENGLAEGGTFTRVRERRNHSRGYYKNLESLLGRSLQHIEAKSRLAENYRILRANIQFAQLDSSPKVWLLTSTSPGEGKTLTTCNLAMSMAETGAKVLLVDCDLRRPRVHHLFNQSRVPGLVDHLASADQEDTAPDWVIRDVGIPNLDVVTCGSRAPNPAELLGSPRMERLLKRWRDTYDVVMLDTAPCLSVVDTVLLARQVDAILLVVRAHHAKEGGLEQGVTTLQKAGPPIAGVILNDVDYSRQYGYYYQYYYRQYYSQYEEDES